MHSLLQFSGIGLLWTITFLCISLNTQGQTAAEYEELLLDTKWQYSHTLNVEANEAIHEADQSYQYFISFKADHSYEYHINGSLSSGKWKVNQETKELYYNFRNIKWWKINKLTQNDLILEFKLGPGVYEYHYSAVKKENSPFNQKMTMRRSMNPVLEQAVAEVSRDLEKFEATQAEKVELAKVQPKKKYELKTKPTPKFIEIALIGGGYYGGLDPVLKDYVLIKTDGRVIKEFESTHQKAMKVKKDIPREDVERLAEFIFSKKFFEYENTYDCTTSECKRRKVKEPTPIPLRLSVTYGNQKKVVTVAIWGQDDFRSKYINYPSDLDLIVAGIQRLVGV